MTTAIIQARMNSSRLPGKVLMKISGKEILLHIVDRIKLVPEITKIIVATGNDEINQPIYDFCESHDIVCYKGSTTDVLSRYYDCAKIHNIKEPIVRITGDCPFIDPKVVSKVINTFNQKRADYASNIHPPTYPDGLDVEVFTFDALKDAFYFANSNSDREHVTPYIWKNNGIFQCENVKNDLDYSSYRFVLDNNEDFELLKIIAENITSFDYLDIINYLSSNPDLCNINSNHLRNSTFVKSSKNYSQNIELFNKAIQITPCGSQTYSKSYRYYPTGFAPNYISNAFGAQILDVDGNQFIDYCLGLGAVTLGYKNSYVDNKVIDQIRLFGPSFSLPHYIEYELAEKLTSMIPSAEMVRFLKNGSDATAAAVRLSRAYTSRSVVAVCGYHGYQDWYIGSTINNNGVPVSYSNFTKTFSYNNIQSLEKIFDENKVACVILEPCQAQGPENNFLQNVKNLCNKNKSVLIFDEIVSGFRISLAGAQELYGVTPDLSAFGKGMGNGYAISALVGKKDILKMIDEDVFISTTFGGDCVSIAASLATIEFMINNNTVNTCIALGNKWLNAAKNMVTDKKLEKYIEIYGISPHCGFIFKDGINFKSTDLSSVYQFSLFESGIVTTGVNNFCYAHTEKNISCFISATEDALDKVKTFIETGRCDSDARISPIFKRNN